MLRVSKKLSEAEFSSLTIGVCLTARKEQVGYVLQFGDFSLYISEYIAQSINLFGISSVDDNIVVRREVTSRGFILSQRTLQGVLREVEDNTLLLSSLSLYLNGSVPEFISVNYNEWGSLSKSYKLFIVCLLGLIQRPIYLTTLYNSCSITEKSELFSFVLSLIRIYQLNINLIENLADIAHFSAETSNFSNSSSSKTIEQPQENVDKIGRDFSVNSKKVIAVERTLGKFHKTADTDFYKNLVEVVANAPQYRGRVSWQRVLVILRDNPKYSATTAKYLGVSGYKLNVNNLRNWHTYYTRDTLKTEKYKVISDISEIEDLLSDIKHNNKDSSE